MSFSLQSSLRRVSQSFVRSFQNRAALRPVPSPNGKITTPQDFLKAIGRSAETKVSLDSWEAFWRTSSHDLKKAELAVKDRRYILWCMEKFRQGIPVEKFAYEAKPKSKIRGRGPRVQNGKLIRSRRPR
ncbi:hypothetical protein HYDPIDRAFT_114230 [Hydnomerulius pinastri MD-312]|uniref:Small ribosomal subunit protein mS41 n=1 Tax=Hydnomerulius pinastri MD-312 TaxID=994086 RepID=A0A0C9VWN7_9AGAM|nr:hypothetical protein HYDPIDRAFT_114230 [Hydnomerulius pinastri MD-312]